MKTKAIVLAAIFCALGSVSIGLWQPAAAADGEGKLAGDWKLTTLGDESPAADLMLTLSVAADGKVSGSSGVNRFAGKLAQEKDNKKLFGPLIMTRRAGPPKAMAVEAAYTEALDEASRFEIKEDKLTLFAADKPRLIFERQKPVKEEER